MLLLQLQAAEAGKFATSDKSSLNYAYHLDSSLYAKYLRKRSEAQGVTRTEGLIEDVTLNPEKGDIASLRLQDGRVIEGDLFIDCTGFRALLIGQALGVKFVDFGHWLPMGRAIAVQTESTGDILPYTRAIAHQAGWQWRIPLQHRVGNGHVYSSAYMEQDAAYEILMNNLDGPTRTDPNFIKFNTGRLERIWEKNCIAVGLSSGFLEPLESTSIHLIQIVATRLIKMFPFQKSSPALAGHFNREFVEEFDSIRDFIILHYIATQRDDTPFWQDRQSLDIPDSLASRIASFRRRKELINQETGPLAESQRLSARLQENLPTNREFLKAFS